MCLVDLAKALLVNVGEVHGVADDIAVEAERRVGGRVGETPTGRGRLGKDGDRVAEGTDRAVGSGAWKEGRSSRKLDVNGRSGRVVVSRRRGRLNVGRFVDGGWYGRHDWRLSSGASAR